MRRFSWFTWLLLAILPAVSGCSLKGDGDLPKSSPEISLAFVPNPYSGLIAIADARNFFKECGLRVSAKAHPSGLAAVEALIKGEAHMATAADFVMATKIFDAPSLRVVASIGSSGASEIVARRDRNIQKPSDLKGKRIGFSAGTTSEYYLDSFLLANRIPFREVASVNIPPAKMIDAIVGGEVDAISSWDFHVFSARKRLGENAVFWPAQNYLDYYWLLIANEELTRSPEAIKRFLRALIMAESFLLANETETKGILAQKFNLEPEFIEEAWKKTRLSLTLNQSMITSLENFARWKMGKEGRTKEVPNYVKHTYADAMVEIEPRAVTLFR